MSVPIFVPILQVDVELWLWIHNKMCPPRGSRVKVRRVTKVIRIYPQGTMNSYLWILMDRLKCCNTMEGSKMTDLLSSPPSELSRRLPWRWVCLYRSCTEVLERCRRHRGLLEDVWSSGWSWTNLFLHPHRYDSGVSSPELQDQKNIPVNTQIEFSIV